MPRIEILTIGDELIEGRLVDTNAGELSAKLAGLAGDAARLAEMSRVCGLGEPAMAALVACARTWFTAISGLFHAQLSVLAAVAPISREPTRPGQWVTAMASRSSQPASASAIAVIPLPLPKGARSANPLARA